MKEKLERRKNHCRPKQHVRNMRQQRKSGCNWHKPDRVVLHKTTIHFNRLTGHYKQGCILAETMLLSRLWPCSGISNTTYSDSIFFLLNARATLLFVFQVPPRTPQRRKLTRSHHALPIHPESRPTCQTRSTTRPALAAPKRLVPPLASTESVPPS